MNIIIREYKEKKTYCSFKVNNTEKDSTLDENNVTLINVMSFNMKRNYFSFGKNSWDKRVKMIVDIIKTQKPDIIGTQELTNNNLIDLKKFLPEYNFVGQGRGGKTKGEFTAVFFLKEKFILKDEQTFWLSSTPNIPSRGWFALFPRTCTVCTLALKDTLNENHLIRIFNTHLDHLSVLSRKKSLQLISKKVNEKNKIGSAKVLLMGDFNTTSSSKTLKRWYAELIESNMLLNDSFYKMEVEDVGRSYHGFKGKIDGTPIDFIFVSHDVFIKKVKLCRDNVNKKYPSDHYPICVQLALDIKV